MTRRRAQRVVEATALMTGVKAGDFVSWKSSKGTASGRVMSVHTKGKVPAVPTELVGTKEKPAARVRLYAPSKGGYAPTTTHLAQTVDALTVIDPLPEASAEAAPAGSLSMDEISRMVQDRIEDRLADMVGGDVWVCVLDLGVDWAVYTVGNSDLWLVNYALQADGTVDVSEPVSVDRITTYVPDADDLDEDSPAGIPDPGDAGGMTEAYDAKQRAQMAKDGTAMADGSYPIANTPDLEAAVASYGRAKNPAAVKAWITKRAKALKATDRLPSDWDGSTKEAVGDLATDHIVGRLLGAKGDDGHGGRIFATQIIAYGDSKNARRYPESVMRAAAPMYEGAKAFDHHRTDAELSTSTVAGLVGYFRNVEPTSEGIQADLYLLPSATHTAEALDASLALQSQGLNPLIGISHDVMARYRPVVDGNRRLQEATEICSVNSADVVADPAAGGRATRMVAGGLPPQERGIAVNFKQLLTLLRAAESAKRSELLVEHASIVESSGYTAEETLRMAEALPAPTPAPVTVPAGGPEYGRESIAGRQLIKAAVADAGLPEKVSESVRAMLGATFTEADVVDKLEVVKAAREGLEKAGFTPSVPSVEVTADAADKRAQAIDDMLNPRISGGYRSLKEAYVDWTGASGRDLFSAEFNRRMFIDSVTFGDDRGREALYSSEGRDLKRSTESVSSSTWGTVLGDSVTRRLVAEYSQPNLQLWRQIVSSVVPVNDFRTQRIERLGGYGTLPGVNQGAPYQPLTSPTNEEVTYAVTKRGGTEDLTLETIANDDLRAVQRIPVKLGLAANRTIFNFVFDFFNTNPNVYDSSAYFVAGHNNTATTVLSNSNLNLARKGMRKQAAYGDTADILSLVPKFLLTVPTNEALAFELCTSAVALTSAAPDGAASNFPNIHQGMTPIIVDYMDATSTTQWFIIADPAMAPTIEIGFYQGQQDPQLFVQNDPTVGSVFTADKVTWKIRHIYSGAVLDFRSAYRGNT